jgi:hypothetical protein
MERSDVAIQKLASYECPGFLPATAYGLAAIGNFARNDRPDK